jgi:hypothetical protein
MKYFGVLWDSRFFGVGHPCAGNLTGRAPDEIRTLLPKDGIPLIDKPEFVTAQAGDKFMKPYELVIGVDIGGDRRAYSVPLLSSYGIVNDVVGGRKIVVTW